MSPDDCLSAAWTHCAPNRIKGIGEPGHYTDPFPRGFWPDVARVAMAMFEQQTKFPTLGFRPTMCSRGDAPEPVKRNKLGLDLSKLEISL